MENEELKDLLIRYFEGELERVDGQQESLDMLLALLKK